MSHEKVAKINLIFVFIMAASGLFFGFFTGSKSIITDGIVSTVILVSSYIGIHVHSSLKPSNEEEYPFGKWRFEYIYNLLRMLTLLVIIAYSFIESIFTIFHYVDAGVVPKEVMLVEVFPYFIIKILAVVAALIWLAKAHKAKYVSTEMYTMESSSIKVDGFLTVAILIGIVVFSHISLISEIADACTLLIVAIILGVSVFKELKHLVKMMIGKRVFVEEEQFIMDLINTKYNTIDAESVYLEKHGMISMIYICLKFEGGMTSIEFAELEREIKSYLLEHEVSDPRIHFYFESN